ncbi:MAG TPA: c-type cytochrome [Gemmatimonadaceae bacterium]
MWTQQRARISGLLAVSVLLACNGDSTAPNRSPYDVADATRGGISYDLFWNASTGFNQADPLIATFNAKGDFFRCKQCHGWDQLGNAGFYINRKPSASRPNISSVNLVSLSRTKTAEQLFAAIKTGTGATRRSPSVDLSTYNPATNPTVGDQMPDYGAIMSDAQIWDLVRFLKAGAFDVTSLYDMSVTGVYPTGSITFSNLGKDGSASEGATIYATKCEFCHGSTGKARLLEGLSLGAFLRGKPNEAQHKIRYGQLGSAMGPTPLTLAEMKSLYRFIADSIAMPR